MRLTGVDGGEEEVALGLVLDVRVNQQRVRLRVDVLPGGSSRVDSGQRIYQE